MALLLGLLIFVSMVLICAIVAWIFMVIGSFLDRKDIDR